ncbi:VOC family protein [Chryseolinea sp. T2]|uniref:VOC family protein n=1 Tax=Chryseolinea sp. T2 TaxID=3129255 RepID=UPI0030778329
MKHEFKPEGYNSASPYLIVNGAQTMIDLLVSLFDAQPLRRYDRPDGSIMHTELRIDDSVIMLSDATQQWPAVTVIMHVYVQDVEKVYQRALTLGCTAVQAPKQQEGDPDRRGTFADFAGNMWSVSTQL